MDGLKGLLLSAVAWAVLVHPAFAAEPTTAPPSSSPDRLASIVTSVVNAQDPRVAEAIGRIEGDGRRLLALRSYLRSSTRLAERWSWTAEQIVEYEKTPEYADLQAEIERVRAAFAAANPGYELWVNPQVRNLDIQLESWNRNESVGAAGDALFAAARDFAASPALAHVTTEKAAAEFERWLLAQVPTPTPTVAAPGLSPHGQMRAIDFQVQQGTALVAGTRTATIAAEWDGAGWTEKLAAAVRTASSRFVGPLESPREPWHYTYTPEALAAR